VHLAIFPEKFSVRVILRRCLVINACPAFLEKRRDNRDAELRPPLRQRRCRWSGNFFGQFEVFVVFGLAKICSRKKFGQTKQIAAPFLAASRMKSSARAKFFPDPGHIAF